MPDDSPKTPTMKLEVVPIPVSNIDRSIQFYREQVGFNLDHDSYPSEGVRVAQLTPPGSACSIVLGKGLGTDIDGMQPGTVKGLHLVVKSVRETRELLAGRGVKMGDVIEYPREIRFCGFYDPDGNSWVLQEFPPNL